MIFEAAKKDRNVNAHIEQVIELAVRFVNCTEEGQVPPTEEIKGFIMQKPMLQKPNANPEFVCQGNATAVVDALPEQMQLAEEQKIQA